jgi:hypothetical protein
LCQENCSGEGFESPLEWQLWQLLALCQVPDSDLHHFLLPQQLVLSGKNSSNHTFSNSLLLNILFGSLAGIVSTTIIMPFHHAAHIFKQDIIQQKRTNRQEYKTVSDVYLRYMTSFKQIKRLYKGMGHDVVAGCLGRAVYFGGYESGKRVVGK